MESVPVRVVLDARFRPSLRGGDRCRFELLRALASDGRVDLLALGLAESASMFRSSALRSSSAGGVRARLTGITPNRHPQAELFEQMVIPRLVGRIRPDVYHGTFHALPALLPRRTRAVVTVHDTALYDRPELFSRAFSALARPQFAAAMRRADRVICVSSDARDRLEELFPRVAGRTSVILNGVGEEFTRPQSPDEVDAALERLAVPRPYVLFVGNLEPKKNLPRLIEAHARLADLPQSLVVVGSRPDGTRPEAGIDGRSRVHRTGSVDEDDLLRLYAGADLVAYPSTYEGFGMPVLEGMAAGVPVLTSDRSSLPEVAGGAAMLVDPFDVESIADGLRRALTDVGWRADAVRRGRARAAELSWRANADSTVEVYRSL